MFSNVVQPLRDGLSGQRQGRDLDRLRGRERDGQRSSNVELLPRRGVNDALLDWYAAHRRDLPWRRTTDPYAILVSEVMLQQTQVARVIPRYEAWLERWPTAAVARAARRSPMCCRRWVGLGYNRRALRLREACAFVAAARLAAGPDRAARRRRRTPRRRSAAFAFGRDTVALDTNVRRALSRGSGASSTPRAGEGPLFNQATIELGALVCRARAPRCDACPFTPRCSWDGDPPGRSARRRCASRTPIAGCAGASSRRWRRGRSCRRSMPGGSNVRSDGLVRDGLVQRDGERRCG